MNKHIERERYLTESRDNAARKRIRERQLTREERSYRKRKVVYWLIVALWAVFILGVLLWDEPAPEAVETPQETAEEVPIEVIEEDTKFAVEAVEAAYDPVRDDIPLDAEIQHLLYKACGETGIRYELALAVIWQETDFRNVVGDGGESYGYMQVQPKWHSERMERLSVTDLSDPYGNFLVGLDFLAELTGKYELAEALTAYNSGKPGDSQYAKDVLNYMKILTMEDF